MSESVRLEAQLRQAQKLEALGTLAGGIAHDFNNILAAILGYTELVQGEIAMTSPLWLLLQRVLTAGLRAKALVQQILAFRDLREGTCDETSFGGCVGCPCCRL